MYVCKDERIAIQCTLSVLIARVLMRCVASDSVDRLDDDDDAVVVVGGGGGGGGGHVRCALPANDAALLSRCVSKKTLNL